MKLNIPSSNIIHRGEGIIVKSPRSPKNFKIGSTLFLDDTDPTKYTID
jgi:hypothetical protein